MTIRTLILIFAMSLVTSCASSTKTHEPASLTPIERQQLIAKLEANGYACEERAALGSRRKTLSCLSPQQMKEDALKSEDEKNAYIYDRQQWLDGIRLY